MINQSILEGLKRATEKGEPLRRAMMSFYNAGYPKEEIEDAARALKMQTIQEEPIQTINQKINSEKKSSDTTLNQPQKVSGYGNSGERLQNRTIQKFQEPEKNLSENTQKISNYEQPKKSKFWIIFLIIILLIFMSGLILFIFFKEQILNFFNKLF